MTINLACHFVERARLATSDADLAHLLGAAFREFGFRHSASILTGFRTSPTLLGALLYDERAVFCQFYRARADKIAE